MRVKRVEIFKRILICILFIAMTGCEKGYFDYRNPFIGDYTFIIHKTSWTMVPPPTDTTYSHEGNISYGEVENTIEIRFRDEGFIDVFVSEDGTIFTFGLPIDFYGEFEPKGKVTFVESYGGSGSGYTLVVSGEKR